MTIEQAIEHAEDIAVSAIGCECREEHRQLAEWLRELQERRKTDSCEGCVYEEGSFLRCVKCKRNKKYYDRYEPGRRSNG